MARASSGVCDARLRGPVVVLLLAGLAAAGWELARPGAAYGQEHPGKPAYDRWCAECHGYDGRGDGPAAAYMLPRPRDFTQARYQIRTTPSGALPADADIMRVLDEGMPGTAMPGWPRLSRRDKDALVGYLKTFSRFFETEPEPEPLSIGRAPRASADAIEAGRELYDRLECWKCHGAAGRGDGSSAPTLTDDDGFPIRAADLTANWYFNGGGTVRDIYTRLRTGMDGTPMPSSDDLIDAGVIDADDLWHLAHYVRDLSPSSRPATHDIIRAALVDGPLPDSPDDPEWDEAPVDYVPLVGQVIVRPRWFAPTVRGVRVQALHDGSEVALRLTWTDPSESPDPAWEDWRRMVTDVMEPKEEPVAEGPLPDAFAVQFPTRIPEGRDLPFFLMGDGREPVYVWRWRSDGGVDEAWARGLVRWDPLEQAAVRVEGSARHRDGEWALVLRRSLAAADPSRQLHMPAGEAIPVAFYAWDGSNGEADTRGSISSWYYLYLDEPTTATVYALPVGAAVFTALLGLFVVARAQRPRSAATAAAGTTGPEPGARPSDAVAGAP